MTTLQRWLENGWAWEPCGALEAILKLGAQVQFGGGMRSLDAVENAIELGVSRVVLGTIAIEQPKVVIAALKKFGPEKIAVGIDARDGLVAVRGWKSDSGILAKDHPRVG